MHFNVRTLGEHAETGDRGNRRSMVIRIGLIVGSLALVYMIAWYLNGVRKELSKKPVYAALQQLEIRYRDQALPTPAQMVTAKGLHVIVLRSDDPADPYDWIATNETDETTRDGVFHLGDVPMSKTPCRTLAPVLNDPTTLANVKIYLRRHCRL